MTMIWHTIEPHGVGSSIYLVAVAVRHTAAQLPDAYTTRQPCLLVYQGGKYLAVDSTGSMSTTIVMGLSDAALYLSGAVQHATIRSGVAGSADRARRLLLQVLHSFIRTTSLVQLFLPITCIAQVRHVHRLPRNLE